MLLLLGMNYLDDIIVSYSHLRRPRWAHLADEFEKRFGHKPSHIVRAPGRVKFVQSSLIPCII